MDKLKDKFEVQIERIQNRLANQQQDLADAEAKYKGRQAEEVLGGVSTVVGMFGLLGGRKRRSLGGLTSAATKRRLTAEAKANIQQAKEDIGRLEEQVKSIQVQMQKEADTLTKQWIMAAGDIQKTRVAPKKSDIDVQAVTLAWAPTWRVSYTDDRGRSRTDSQPAYPGAEEA